MSLFARVRVRTNAFTPAAFAERSHKSFNQLGEQACDQT